MFGRPQCGRTFTLFSWSIIFPGRSLRIGGALPSSLWLSNPKATLRLRPNRRVEDPPGKIKDFLWKTHHTKHWSCSLEAAITSGSLTLPDNPFVFGEKYYNFFLRYSCQHYLFSYVQTMKHCSSSVLNVPLPNLDISYYNQGRNISKRHDFGRLSRPVKFSVLNSIRLLRCYTVIKR